jgi:hypothetical protein
MLATPMYGGQAHAGYVVSVAELFAICALKNIEIVIQYMIHESLIPRARNMLVKTFIKNSEYTHLLFIDADIKFDPNDILKLLELDKDVIGMPYAKKQLDWNRIKNCMQESNNNLTTDLLEKCGISYILKSLPDQDTSSTLYEAAEIGTGLMMIKREVIEKMVVAYSNLYALSDDMSTYKEEDVEGRKYYLLFETLLDPTNHRYLSEDYAFCKRWRDIDGKIYIYLPVTTIHYGSYGFEYNSNTVKLV